MKQKTTLEDLALKAARFLWGYLFPSFQKKITLYVLGLGGALLLDGFLQGLLRWLLLILAAKVTGQQPPTIQSVSPDGEFYGVLLVGLALAYSFAGAVLDLLSDWRRQEEENSATSQLVQRDRALYRTFLNDFGSNSPLASFVREHNFGGSWHTKHTNALFSFLDQWSVPEREFIHPEVAEIWKGLLREMIALARTLEEASGPLQVNPDLSGIFDPSIHDEMEMPDNVSNGIDRANHTATQISQFHRNFVRKAEAVLAPL